MSGPDPHRTLAGLGEERACWHAIFPHLPGGRRRARSGRATTPRWSPLPAAACSRRPTRWCGGRDWRDEWSTGADVGAKAVAQNLADVAAMGGVPTGAAGHPGGRAGDQPGLGGGLRPGARARRRGRPGSRSSAVTCPRRRRAPWSCRSPRWATWTAGARCCARGRGPGTSSRWPAAWGARRPGWLLLQRGRQAGRGPVPAWTTTARPTPDLAAGPAAAAAGATAMLDVSDGLLRDAGRIARASGVGHRPRPRRCWSRTWRRSRRRVGERGRPPSACSPAARSTPCSRASPPAPPCRRGGGRSGRSCGVPGVLVDGAPQGPGGGWDHFGG